MLPLRRDPTFSGVYGERTPRPDGLRLSSRCTGHVHAGQVSLLRRLSTLEGMTGHNNYNSRDKASEALYLLRRYNGYLQCAMPVRVMKLVGVTHLIATNAAGGLNPTYKVGDIMIVKDHVNMMGFAGNNPLQGPNDDRWDSRFVCIFFYQYIRHKCS